MIVYPRLAKARLGLNYVRYFTAGLAISPNKSNSHLAPLIESRGISEPLATSRHLMFIPMLRKLQIVLVAPLILAWVLAIYRLNDQPQTPVAPVRTATTPPIAPSSTIATDTDFDQHVEALKKKLPSNDFTIVIQPPFVVIGDESPAAVKEHSERTVKWAVDKLKQDYFVKDPKEILDIWLFNDSASVDKNTVRPLGEK